MKLLLHEERVPDDEVARRRPTTTVVKVRLRPIRGRDRRLPEISGCSRQLIASVKSYLMGTLVS